MAFQKINQMGARALRPVTRILGWFGTLLVVFWAALRFGPEIKTAMGKLPEPIKKIFGVE